MFYDAVEENTDSDDTNVGASLDHSARTEVPEQQGTVGKKKGSRQHTGGHDRYPVVWKKLQIMNDDGAIRQVTVKV